MFKIIYSTFRFYMGNEGFRVVIKLKQEGGRVLACERTSKGMRNVREGGRAQFCTYDP